MPTLDPDVVLERLNDILKTDRAAITELIEHRVPCNRDLCDHPTVQVLTHEGPAKVGLLGIINGLVGVQGNGRGYIAAFADENGVITHFGRDDEP